MIEEARKHSKVMPPQTVEYCVLKPGLLKSKNIANELNPSIIHTIDPDFRERGQVKVYLTEFGDSAINLRMQVWFKDRSDAFTAGCEIREAIKTRFDDEGIEMPYPYRTIVFKKEEDKEKSSEKPASPEEIKKEYAPDSRLTDIEDKKDEEKDQKDRAR
jgi:small-conductance mechanosensitive channel